MTDRELLEFAAKSANYSVHGWIAGRLYINFGEGIRDQWDPLADDGDALRLAVKLGIKVTPFLSGACAVETPDGWRRTESGYKTGDEATRRAIVRAGAEIGKAMP